MTDPHAQRYRTNGKQNYCRPVLSTINLLIDRPSYKVFQRLRRAINGEVLPSSLARAS